MEVGADEMTLELVVVVAGGSGYPFPIEVGVLEGPHLVEKEVDEAALSAFLSPFLQGLICQTNTL